MSAAEWVRSEPGSSAASAAWDRAQHLDRDDRRRETARLTEDDVAEVAYAACEAATPPEGIGRFWRRGRGKKPVYARSRGTATQNGSHEPGRHEVTIWGAVDGETFREVGVTLGEEDIRRLLGYLGRYGYYSDG